MNIKEVCKHMEKNIKVLETQIFDFETIAIPRYNADKQVLVKLRQEFIRVMAVREKMERGEDVSQDEFRAALPESFRT